MKLPVKEAYEPTAAATRPTTVCFLLESNQRASTAGPFVRPDGPVQRTVIFLKARPRRKQQAIGLPRLPPGTAFLFSKPSRNGQPCGKDGRLPVVPRQHPSFP